MRKAVVLSVTNTTTVRRRKRKEGILYHNACGRCIGEFFGDGFGERLSHCGGRGGVSGCCNGLRGECGSGFVSARAGTASRSGSWSPAEDEANSGPISDVPDHSRARPRLRPLLSPPLSSEVVGPMTSLTMLPRSTACDGEVSGSVSCDAADGGGHTLSWKMEPDSDARARNRRGGDDGTGECDGESGRCEYEYAAYG